MSKKKLLITGADGLVGSNLSRFYTKNNKFEIRSINRSVADLRNISEVENVFSEFKPDFVIHAAARVGGIQANLNSPTSFLLENLEMSSNIIKLSHKYKVEKLITFGSSCMYPVGLSDPMPEELIFTGAIENSSKYYASAKLVNLNLVESYNKEFGHKWLCLIPATIYGPGDNFSLKNSHVISAMIRKFHEAKQNDSKEIIFWGNGQPRREFIFIDDLVNAVDFFMLKVDLPLPLNIGVGKDISILELANKIANITGFSGDIKWDSSKPNGALRKLLDSSKAFELGWKPTVNLDLGLIKTLEFYIGSQQVRRDD